MRRSGKASKQQLHSYIAMAAICVYIPTLCTSPVFLLTAPRTRESRLYKVSLRALGDAPISPIAEPESADAVIAAATEEENITSDTVYTLWKDQFPIAAARQDFYFLSCTRADVRSRFLFVARSIGVSAQKALEIFSPDLWVLCISSEKFQERLEALRSVAESKEEIVDFLREVPRALGTTTATEIKDRGIANMRVRAAVGAAYELIAFPLRFVAKAMARNTARQIEMEVKGGNPDAKCPDDKLDEFDEEQRQQRIFFGNIFFATLFGVAVGLSYVEKVYGGPIHGKGICVPSVLPTFNIPDVEGNTRLPCNCAPVYKWYIEPQLSLEQQQRMLGMRPAVESKNCGKDMTTGKKIVCNPKTAGGCVWTEEDLKKDPSTWDSRELTYWEKRRENK